MYRLAQPNNWRARLLTEIGNGDGVAGFREGYIEFSFEHVNFEMPMSHPSEDTQKAMETQFCSSREPHGPKL